MPRLTASDRTGPGLPPLLAQGGKPVDEENLFGEAPGKKRRTVSGGEETQNFGLWLELLPSFPSFLPPSGVPLPLLPSSPFNR